jgi:BCCT, betaine/carnitine/choline family transporter
MNNWTVFYWGWWVAWAPFVGMFIAKVSRGRTVLEVIVGALAAPVIFTCTWFGIFGAIALRVERQAANMGITCDGFSDPMVTVDGAQLWRLSCRSSTDMWFDMLTNFPMHQCAPNLPSLAVLRTLHSQYHLVSAGSPNQALTLCRH